ncbi:hypothetical protein NC651_034726 [Populus alba x Populus x berolinensis]|nr:hypothetical protein NC651_034726 [Populus alba x Populus x berolinensis]
MVEGGVVKAADKTELTECWKVTWKTPYITRLAFSAGTGGLLFVALALSLVTPGLDALGSIISMLVEDRYGRKNGTAWRTCGLGLIATMYPI